MAGPSGSAASSSGGETSIARMPRTLAAIEHGSARGLHVGAQLYVSRGGEPVADVAIGMARDGVPMTPDSLMLWMSSVKPVLGVAVAQQWERGRLTLDDPVAAHLPAFAAKGKERITIRHVLTHTGGFRAVAHQWSNAPWDDIIAEICSAEIEPGWVPGHDAGYHVASGWYVLAEVVRRLDGRSFDRYVREAIFAPLGMYDSWVGMPRERHRAYGARVGVMHDTSGEQPQPHPYWPWAGSEDACALCRPGGSAWGPVHELGWFYEALLAGGQRGRERILTPQTIEAITARHTVGMLDRTFGTALDRGLGVVLDSKSYGEASAWYGPHCSPRTFGHGGFASSVGFADPEHHLVVALVFNGMAAAVPHAERMRATVAAIYEDVGLG